MLSVLSKFVQLESLLVYEPRQSGSISHASKYYTMKMKKKGKTKESIYLRLSQTS